MTEQPRAYHDILSPEKMEKISRTSRLGKIMSLGAIPLVTGLSMSGNGIKSAVITTIAAGLTYSVCSAKRAFNTAMRNQDDPAWHTKPVQMAAQEMRRELSRPFLR